MNVKVEAQMTYPSKKPLLTLVVAIVLSWSGGDTNAAPPAVQNDRVVVIDAGQIIDGTSAAPLRDARLVITGDRVTRIGPAASVPLPQGAEHVELPGGTITPGLIDLHFHIENDPKLA
jgi:adenine deaminase